MKTFKWIVMSLFFLSTGVSGAIASESEPRVEEEHMFIAIKTDDVDLQELDISHLQVGDAETIVTDNGKTIDILRTEDDVEIYINGELLEIGPHMENADRNGEMHVVHKQIEISCDEATECDEMVWSESGHESGHDGAADSQNLHEVEKVVIIHKEVSN